MIAAYLLLVLLPPLFLTGWLARRPFAARRLGERTNVLSSDYFRGLNYLLNKQQDKVIEMFLRLAEYKRDAELPDLA